MLDESHANPSVLGASVVAVGDSVGPSNTGDSANAELFESLARLCGEDLTLTILPVRQVSVGGSELNEADAEEVAQFLDATLPPVDSGVVPIEADPERNGAPGVGEEVAENLVGRGFRVALGGNAQNFTHATSEDHHLTQRRRGLRLPKGSRTFSEWARFSCLRRSKVSFRWI